MSIHFRIILLVALCSICARLNAEENSEIKEAHKIIASLQTQIDDLKKQNDNLKELIVTDFKSQKRPDYFLIPQGTKLPDIYFFRTNEPSPIDGTITENTKIKLEMLKGGAAYISIPFAIDRKVFETYEKAEQGAAANP